MDEKQSKDLARIASSLEHIEHYLSIVCRYFEEKGRREGVEFE